MEPDGTEPDGTEGTGWNRAEWNREPSESPQNMGSYEIPNPLFSVTYKRSRRDTAAKRLVRSRRFCFVFKKSSVSQKQAYTHLKKCANSKTIPHKPTLGAPNLEFHVVDENPTVHLVDQNPTFRLNDEKYKVKLMFIENRQFT